MNGKLLTTAKNAWRYLWIKNNCTNKISLYGVEGVEGVELEFTATGDDLDDALDEDIEQYGHSSEWNNFLAELTDSTVPDGWVSVADGLPKHGDSVYVYMEKRELDAYSYQEYSKYDGFSNDYGITHWQAVKPPHKKGYLNDDANCNL